MYSKELSERNPLRLFEHSIHGGVGPGNLGVVVARHGIGKTAFLVGIALDDAIRGRKVLHVSLDKTVDHTREFYDEIFMDLARSAGLEDLATARIDMERHRMIHTYAGGTFSVDKLRHSMEFLKETAHFEPECLIIQGFHFDKATTEDVEALRKLAGDFKVELWMSALTHRESLSDNQGIPDELSKFTSAIAVIVQMADDKGSVKVSLLKDHDNPNVAKLSLSLDPATMLLVTK
jgi:hypothetical protein